MEMFNSMGISLCVCVGRCAFPRTSSYLFHVCEVYLMSLVVLINCWGFVLIMACLFLADCV
jgi:hypothetical protein